jgi:hypothetical protein
MSKPIDIFIRCEGRLEPVLQESHDGATVASLRAILDEREPSPDALLFEENADEPLSDQQLIRIGDDEAKVLHRNRCRSVHVAVRYAGRELAHDFGPGSTLDRIKRWAERKFGIAASDAAHLSLQLHGSTERPPGSIHVGSLVKGPSCGIAFDLLPSERVNGGA